MKASSKKDYLSVVYFVSDMFAVVAAYYASLLFRFYNDLGVAFFSMVNRTLGVRDSGDVGISFEAFYIDSAPRIVFLLVVVMGTLYALHDLYAGRRFIRRQPEAWNILSCNVIALLLFYAYFYLRRNVFHPRSMFGTVLVLNVVLCIVFRWITGKLIELAREKYGKGLCRAVLMGGDEAADQIATFIKEIRPNGITIVERLDCDASKPFGALVRDLRTTVEANSAEMIISAEKGLSVAQTMELLDLTGEMDISLKLLSDKFDVLVNNAKVSSDTIHDTPLVHFEPPSCSQNAAWVRRVASLLLAVVGVLVFLPVALLVSGLIRLTSRGPVLFVQERIGVNRKPFRMYKFRTMYEQAAEQQAEVEEFNESGSGLFKIRKDPRVTPVGRLIRRFSLDELPQLWNVVKGEMTLVGPRPLPERDFANYYEDWHYGRHNGLPGLTCLWQVSGRSDLDFHNMCILDLYYLRNQSWILDLKILLRTFWVVIFAKGAY